MGRGYRELVVGAGVKIEVGRIGLGLGLGL